MESLQKVTCPSCFELFSLNVFPEESCSSQLDYDCEICCRPMTLVFDEEGNVHAISLDELS